MGNMSQLSKDDQDFLKNLRAVAIFVIVFGHVGGFWFFQPYSSFLLTIIPVFFFISGSVSFFSYERNPVYTSYLIKRLIGLLTPYYFVCILVILFCYVEGLKLPIDPLIVIKWITVTPTADGPTYLGQVWFLRVLIMITFIAPLLFDRSLWDTP